MSAVQPGAQSGYRLVIAEKTDAARRIAGSLGRYETRHLYGIEFFEVEKAFDERRYTVCAASGHLYALGDPSGARRAYPVFDIEWFPLDVLLSKTKRWRPSKNDAGGNTFSYGRSRDQRSKRIRVISELAAGCNGEIVHACDYDIEGETIGRNIIEYACMQEGKGGAGKEIKVLRAKFSTLTEEEIRQSFAKLGPVDDSISEAGRARHAIDFMWGINLSRALSEAYRRAASEFRNLTIGRVQGPALSFVAEREVEVKTHVPTPYWTLDVLLEKDGIQFDVHYVEEKIETRAKADLINIAIPAQDRAIVHSINESTVSEVPPYPFNLGDLQREAFRLFRIGPSETLSIAERLYLKALISYPRTSSQKLPISIWYSKIINRLMQNEQYSKFAMLMKEGERRPFPMQGRKDDPAHPAIYPTGLGPQGALESKARRIYDLVVRRFLSAFAKDALSKYVDVDWLIGSYHFVSNQKQILVSGWREIYPFFGPTNVIMPDLKQGDGARIISSSLNERFSKPPPRYSQATLLEKMESQNIGTKSTRAEIVSTLLERGYIEQMRGGRDVGLTATETGLVLMETLNEHCHKITSAELTRSTEEEIDCISLRRENAEAVLAETMQNLIKILEQIQGSQDQIGMDLHATLSHKQPVVSDQSKPAAFPSNSRLLILGRCPSCKSGDLKMITSLKTHKRFAGCTNYPSCKTSAPLPQKGLIKKTSRLCPSCDWPIVSVGFARRNSRRKSWILCINPSCPSKINKKQGD